MTNDETVEPGIAARAATVEREFIEVVTAATTDLMTDKELAAFVGRNLTELVPTSPRRASRKRRATTPQ